jgi:two-component system chemotaxis sensor kinase CheA
MDISRFHATFFEESRENIAAMEAGLLAMESGGGSGDTIHVIFRAAHSIKGGSATFGFAAIADFTHLLETLLEEARSGRRVLDAPAISALLASVDALRMLLVAAEHGDAVDQPMLQQARAGLEKLLAGDAAPAAAAAAAPAAPPAIGWQIEFAPERSLFLSGNDPLRMLRELGQLGELKVTCRDDALPPFSELDPFEAWLAWDLPRWPRPWPRLRRFPSRRPPPQRPPQRRRPHLSLLLRPAGLPPRPRPNRPAAAAATTPPTPPSGCRWTRWTR